VLTYKIYFYMKNIICDEHKNAHIDRRKVDISLLYLLVGFHVISMIISMLVYPVICYTFEHE